MNTYLSTFISGLQRPVSNALQKSIPGVAQVLLTDGLVVYKTTADIRKLDLRFFNNTFIVMEIFKNTGSHPVQEMIQDVLKAKSVFNKIQNSISGNGKTFRVVASVENTLTSIDASLLKNMEYFISRASGLTVDRSNPHMEFWFLYRKEKIGFFMLRLANRTPYLKAPNKGELHTALSHILCSLSEPCEKDVFMDPFCGYGSIPVERALSFPYGLIFAADKNMDTLKIVKQKIKAIKNKKLQKTFIVKAINSLDMSLFEDGFIDKIVTDPPWGLYEDARMPIATFYRLMMGEFYRILKTGGVIVMLTAQKEVMENILVSFDGTMALKEKYDILVSGKKAAVYKITKIM